jgi:dTMP kinase
MAEILLLYAARQMHVEKLIKPALKAGKIVISDRFADSTRAYQSYGHGMDIDLVNKVNDVAIDGFAPDLTFIMDLSPEVGLSRAGARLSEDNSGEDRFEQLDTSFHDALREGYLDIARKEPQRCVVIDANKDIDALTDELEAAIVQRLDTVKSHAV